MAEIFADDLIDFAQYMQDTDSDHRVRPASEYAKEVEEYFHGTEHDHGIKLPWAKTHDKIAIRPNEVTVWGGYNGHGKSAVIGQVVMHFMRQYRHRVCIASMEMKPYITLARMCRQAAGCIPEPEYIHRFHKGTNGLLWMYDQQGTVSGDKMAAVIRYAHEKHQVQHFVIDSLLKCGFAEDDYNGQKFFVDKLCSIARDTGVHVHLVHHSRKSDSKAGSEHKIPTKADMRGTGSIIDQVDNLIIVWRNKKKEEDTQSGAVPSNDSDAVLAIEKQRNGEWEGKIALWFDVKGRGLIESGATF